MTEKNLTEKLRKALLTHMPTAVIFKAADSYTSGIPDLYVAWNEASVWLEVKHLDPKFKDREIQRRTMKRLQLQAGAAWYVLYAEPNKGYDHRRTYVIRAEHIDAFIEGDVVTGFTLAGHDHDAVAGLIRTIMASK